MKKLEIIVYFPIPLVDMGVGHTCLSVTGKMQSDDLRVSLLAPMVRGIGVARHVSSVAWGPLNWLPYRTAETLLAPRMTREFLRRAATADVAYLWSETPLELAHQLRDLGIKVIREKFNCHKAVAKEILDDAYARLGWPVTHGITDAAVAKEREELALANFVFAPSPSVHESLAREGIEESRILDSSYGWEPSRLPQVNRPPAGSRPLTFLFTGFACVRKGTPTLLDAWARAGLKDARLLLAGDVADDVKHYCAAALGRPDVTVLGFTSDVRSIYSEGDVFMLPTLEEGDALVTHEAMASGLPVITTRMGAGTPARAGSEALVVDPHDTDGLAAAMRRIAEDRDLRVALGESARRRAQEFTWAAVGARRRELLLSRVRSRAELARQAAADAAPEAVRLAPARIRRNRHTRVSFVVPGIASRSGGLRVTVAMGNLLLDRGFDVRILYTQSKPLSVARAREVFHQIPSHLVRRSDTDWTHLFRGPIQSCLDLNELEFAPGEIVVAVGTHTIDEVAGIRAPVTKVRYNHGFPAVLTARQLAAYRIPMLTITVAGTLVPMLEDLTGQKVLSVVPNGTDPRDYSVIPDVRRDSVGTIFAKGLEKAPQDMIALFSRLRGELPGVPRIAFGPHLRPRELDVAEYIHYPSVSQAERFYNRSLVWVLTSHFEGFGIPILEAMACGAVVVSADNLGAQELIRDGVNGRIVPKGDIDAFVHAIRDVIENPELRARLAAEGLRTAARFSWQDAADRMVALLDGIVGAPSPA